jgi:glycosyltransferase involved in cell wall biosynthesis
MRLKILALEALPVIAGGQQVLLDLVPALKEHYDLHVMLPGEGPLAGALRELGVPYTCVAMGDYTLVSKDLRDVTRYAVYLPWLTWRGWRLMRTLNVDLVFANSTRAFVWGTLAARLAGVPIVWYVHNLVADRLTGRLLNRVGRWPMVRALVCASEEAAEQFPPLRSKATVIPTGVDLTVFRPLAEGGATMRSRFGIPPTARVVGMVADLIPLKGQDVLIEAAAQVLVVLPDVYFLLAGKARPQAESQSYAEGLRRRVTDLGLTERVIFVGYQSDLAALLNALDVLVVASTTETGPLVLFDALACGVPVISTPVGWAPVFLGGRACGTLFPFDDERALARDLVALLSNVSRRQGMGQEARRCAEAQLDLLRFRARIVALLGGVKIV